MCHRARKNNKRMERAPGALASADAEACITSLQSILGEEVPLSTLPRLARDAGGDVETAVAMHFSSNDGVGAPEVANEEDRLPDEAKRPVGPPPGIGPPRATATELAEGQEGVIRYGVMRFDDRNRYGRQSCSPFTSTTNQHAGGGVAHFLSARPCFSPLAGTECRQVCSSAGGKRCPGCPLALLLLSAHLV